MKRISFFLLLIMAAGIVLCCNKDNGSTDTGYTDPDLDTKKTQAFKSYTFNDSSLSSYSCSSSKSCGAIIYTGRLNKIYYTGFAVSNGSNFSLKIYWNAKSISSPVNTTSFAVKIVDPSYTYNTTSDNLNITIEATTDTNSVTVYKITFNEDLNVSDSSSHTVRIAAGDIIIAYKYPE